MKSEDRCSEDVWVRRGEKEGSCGYFPILLRKAITLSLGYTTSLAPAETRSPGYEAIKNFKITSGQINNILADWIQTEDLYGYGPRQVVCEWVRDNLDDLARYVPTGYPRVFVEDNFGNALNWGAVVFSCIVFAVTGFSYFITSKYSGTKTMKYAQPKFLRLVLCGFTFLLIGSLLVSMSPSRASCTSAEWFIHVGYTLSVAPLLVKVAAINKTYRFTTRMQRSNVDLSHMYTQVAGCVGVIIVYMCFWTAFDAPTRILSLHLESELSNEVQTQERCSSSMDGWFIGAMAWRFPLLFLAAFLAFQNKAVSKQFKEASILATMAYSRFVFYVMLSILYFLDLYPNVKTASRSFLYSLDVFTATCIYFGSKFLKLRQKEKERIQREYRLNSLYSMNGTVGHSRHVNNFSRYSQEDNVDIMGSKESQIPYITQGIKEDEASNSNERFQVNNTQLDDNANVVLTRAESEDEENKSNDE